MTPQKQPKFDKIENLLDINKKISQLEGEQDKKIEGFTNIGKMTASDTFKGQKKG
jgi:hypothetical protein